MRSARCFGVYDRGCGDGAGFTLSASGFPHSPQNFIAGGFSKPQLEQLNFSDEPHSPQNFIALAFSKPQAVQRIEWCLQEIVGARGLAQGNEIAGRVPSWRRAKERAAEGTLTYRNRLASDHHPRCENICGSLREHLWGRAHLTTFGIGQRIIDPGCAASALPR
jgi:hypothetical protein